MKKKKYNILKIIFYSLLLIYIVMFFATSTGYYEYKNYKKKELTSEQIKKFEQDIKDGKAVDINEYLVVDKYSYKTNLSMLAIKISNGISNIVSECVKQTFKWVSKFVDE